ncbi:MAG TPA: tetratricopeptide repeat protein [Planctomycetaceae bacterium]|jgi:tetratricopeptide (TPR) repeat protein|nr:tetratricopeptide repeat protein [Planctomycetaceae bacterium]
MRNGVYDSFRYGCMIFVIALGGSTWVAADASDAKQSAAPAKAEPHFPKLGNHSRKVATTSPVAQEYFDQGLAFLYGFNHDEAIRSFEAAAGADPQCAMAYWGIAAANGPHINNPNVDEAHAKAAWKAFTKARELAGSASAVDQALIDALGKRYADPQPEDRKPLDAAYAGAMRKVWEAHPDDADVGAMTAEALMDLRPWDQWTLAGKPQPGTEEVLQILNAVLAKAPKHPLAVHLLIHAVEASPHPERADAAADRLRDLMPGLGHMVHMPSHIDVRRGRWQEAVVANEKAISADKVYRAVIPQQGLYRIYMAHNHHMLAYAAMMQGQSLKAGSTIKELLASVPDDFIKKQAGLVDGFFALPFELHIRFGQWDDMLAEPKPRAEFPVSTALWHYARGVAFAAKGQVDLAKGEQAEFRKAVKSIPPTAVIGKNLAVQVFGVAEKMLDGEILYREGKVDEGIAALRDSAKREDRLRYIEPPDWIQPVRHALGAALLESGRFADAEQVYRDDLARYPQNGWALYGLSRALKQQGKQAEALAVKLQFDKAWEHADIKLTSSCFCLQPK